MCIRDSLEGGDLTGRDQYDAPEVARGQRHKETANHDQSPDRTNDKVVPLGVFGQEGAGAGICTDVRDAVFLGGASRLFRSLGSHMSCCQPVVGCVLQMAIAMFFPLGPLIV